jgi:hypothetical protein
MSEKVEHVSLRAQIAASVMPQTLAIALKGYGYVCPNVTDRACRSAFEVADAFLKYAGIDAALGDES